MEDGALISRPLCFPTPAPDLVAWEEGQVGRHLGQPRPALPYPGHATTAGAYPHLVWRPGAGAGWGNDTFAWLVLRPHQAGGNPVRFVPYGGPGVALGHHGGSTAFRGPPGNESTAPAVDGRGWVMIRVVSAQEVAVETLHIETTRQSEMVDITDALRQIVRRRGLEGGLLVAYVPHTTAGITVNENADPTVRRDILADLDRLVPRGQPSYRHLEGNSDSHTKASLVGHSATLIIEGGDLVLGTWQGVFFCEFDGPRRRRVYVQLLNGAVG